MHVTHKYALISIAEDYNRLSDSLFDSDGKLIFSYKLLITLHCSCALWTLWHAWQCLRTHGTSLYHSLSDSKCFSRSRRPDHIYVYVLHWNNSIGLFSIKGMVHPPPPPPKKLYLLNLKTCLVTHILQNEFFFRIRKKRIQVYWGTVHWTNHWCTSRFSTRPFLFSIYTNSMGTIVKAHGF